MPKLTKIIPGYKFIEWLQINGIAPSETRRVVIDASVDSVVQIYIEKYGTDKLLVTPAKDVFDNVKIKVINDD